MNLKSNTIQANFEEVYNNLQEANLFEVYIDNNNNQYNKFYQTLDGIEMIISKPSKVSVFGMTDLDKITFLFRSQNDHEHLFQIEISRDSSRFSLNMNDRSTKEKLDDGFDYNQITDDENFYIPLLESVEISKRFELINQKALIIIEEKKLREKEQKEKEQKEKERIINESLDKIKQMRKVLAPNTNAVIKNNKGKNDAKKL